MKKHILWIILFLLLFISSVYADRISLTTKGFNTNQLIKRGDAKVYYVDFIATANGGEFSLQDVNDAADRNVADGSTTMKAEGKEATSGNSKHYDFSVKPLEFSTGLYLTIISGIVVITYE